MRRAHPEDDLQKACAEWLDLQGWLWWHTPNGGARWKSEAARLKGLGVKRGVPDILIFERWVAGDPARSGSISGFGVAIELKVSRNRLTPEQQLMRDWLIARGWLAETCRSLDEVMELCACVNPGPRVPWLP